MAGVRIAGELTFTPAYIKPNGTLVQDRCSVPIIANSRRGTGPDGKPGRQNDYKLVGWRGLARSLCRWGSTGKALDLVAEVGSYEGREYKMAPNPANPAEMIPQAIMVGGQPLLTKKVGFTVTELNFGEDSPKQIQRELQLWASNPGNIAGRPPQWNVVGSTDATQFAQIIDQRKLLTWDGVSPTYGYARVVLPQNAQRILTVQERQIIETQGARALNLPTAQATVQPAVQPVTATFTAAQPVAQPVTQPIGVAATFTAQPTAQPIIQPVTQYATGAAIGQIPPITAF